MKRERERERERERGRIPSNSELGSHDLSRLRGRHSQPTKPARKHRSAAPAPHHGHQQQPAASTTSGQARSRSAPSGDGAGGGRREDEVMLREGRVEKVQMKQRASISSLEDVARLQKQSEELEKVCRIGRQMSPRFRLNWVNSSLFSHCEWDHATQLKPFYLRCTADQ